MPIRKPSSFPALSFSLAAAFLALASPVAWAADPAAGEEGFKKCKACHAIIAPDGAEIQNGGRVGPNLYGVIGRALAGDPDYLPKYGPSILAAAALGMVWDEAALVAYLADPTAWLQQATGDSAARSKMTFKLAKGGEDVAAYLASVAQ